MNNTADQIGWFDKFKNSFDIDSLIKRLSLSKQKLLDMALFLGIGFLIGFLWKRYANYFIAAIIFVALLIVLQQLDVISMSINWKKIQECCGVQPVKNDIDFVGMLWEWVKANVLIVFSFIIGFCFGAKVS